jgi:hypothetical protein
MWNQRNVSKTMVTPFVFVQLYNIVWQVVFFLHYTVYYESEIAVRTISLVWIMSMGIASIVVLLDLEILQVYASIISFATHSNVRTVRGCVVALYLVCCIIPIGKLVFGSFLDLWEWEQFSGMSFVLLCLFYDNCHSAFLIYKLSKRNRDKKINPTALENALRTTIWWNAVVATIDWVTLAVVFSTVLLTRGRAKAAVEQCTSGLLGIHASTIATLFRTLKDLTFAGQRPKVLQPIKPMEVATVVESKTQKMV